MIKCIGEIVNAAKGAITRKEAENIIKEIEKRFNAQMPKQDVPTLRRLEIKKDPAAMSTQERMVLAAEEAFLNVAKEKKGEVKRAQLQVQRTDINMKNVALYGHGVEGVQELLLRDVYNKAKGIEETWFAQLYKTLEDVMKSGSKFKENLQLEIARHILDPELLNKTEAADASAAEKIARAYVRIKEEAFNRKNSAGADIGYLRDHIVPQAWDANNVRWFGLNFKEKLAFRPDWAGGSSAVIARMREKARENWVEFVLPKLDRERYLDDTTGQKLNDEHLREVMGNVWQTIASHGLSGLDPAAVGGQSSLAKQLAAHRELHFKDAESFIEANKSFGTRDLYTAMAADVRRHANDLAQLETFGPNPDAGFKTALAYGMKYGAEKTTFGREGSTRTQVMWDEFTGRNNIVAEDKFDLIARTMQGARDMLAASKLGLLPFSQLADIGTFFAIAKSDGLGMGDAFRALFQMLNPLNAADRAMARDHALLSSMMANDIMLRYNTDNHGTTWTSKAANAVMQWSGAKYMTDSFLQGYQILIAKTAAAARELSFAELEPAFARMLKNQGITEAHWDIIRQSDTVKIGHFDVITPMTIKRTITKEMDASASQPGARATTAAELQVREAMERYAGMLSEEARVGVLHPGLKDQAIVKGSTHPGEIPGELMRNIFFFKTFSVAMITKVLPRVFSAEYGPVKSRVEVGAQLLVGMMLTGALAVQLKEIFKGKNPRDMTDPHFWGAAFMQAGGLGIFGDFMLADANRFGGGFVSTLGGPVAGMVQDIQKLTVGNAATAADGKHHKKGPLEDLAGDSIQFAKNYAPLMNLWYTRLALDHLVFYQIQEAINPGYLHRMKQRTKAQNNQTFWWDPNDSTPESGPSLSEAFGGN